MTRVLRLALMTVALLGVAVPGAYAQAPAPTPQVTITGFHDHVTGWTKNGQESLLTRTGDTEWYARTRGRFDVIGALGRAKMVLGLEIDATWGQVGATDTINDAAGVAGGVTRPSTGSGAFDLNTDTRGIIEIKWLYTEFPLPLIPWPTMVRIGAQPANATYKLGVLLRGDVAGVNLTTTFNPNLKWHFFYGVAEENLTGSRRATGFGRGEDFLFVTSLDVTPFKGLDIRPTYGFMQIVGAIGDTARQNPGGIGGTPTFTRSPIGGVAGLGLYEARHTIGIDSRWRSGPFSLDPTFFYQFGQRDTDNPFVGPGAPNAVREADISAFFFDVIGGWRIGPLLLQARYNYSTGNRDRDQLSQDVNYYQPYTTDSGFWGDGWGEINSLGIDYHTGCIYRQCTQVSFNRYGRQQFALRAIYSLTPNFDVRAVVRPSWTARSVDTDGTQAFALGSNTQVSKTCATHSANSAASPRGAGCRGDATYVGTEVNLGLTWRFAPGLVFDLVGSVLFAGDALDNSERLNGVLTKREADNAYAIASRVRYSF
jgi:hypothetical protein